LLGHGGVFVARDCLIPIGGNVSLRLLLLFRGLTRLSRLLRRRRVLPVILFLPRGFLPAVAVAGNLRLSGDIAAAFVVLVVAGLFRRFCRKAAFLCVGRVMLAKALLFRRLGRR
jgi:hypothetical protein